MAELADALDSGSSGHCARAGSSPVIRSNCGKDHCGAQWSFLFGAFMRGNKPPVLLGEDKNFSI